MKTRSRFLLASILFLAGSIHAADAEFKVGIQTWTLRNMDFDQVIDFALKHKVKYLEMIDKHINPKGPVEVRRCRHIRQQGGESEALRIREINGN